MLHSVRNNEGYEYIMVPSLMCYVMSTFIGPTLIYSIQDFLLGREEIDHRKHIATMG